MSFIEEILERDIDWYSGLGKREDGGDDGDDDDDHDDDDDDDDDDEQNSSTSTSQTQTSTSSSITSTTYVESTTSTTQPTRSSLTSSSSTTSKTVKTTLPTSAILTPASLSATQKGKGNASTTSSSTKSSSTSLTTAQVISSGLNTNTNTPSKTTINLAIGLSVLGLLLISLLLFIFRHKIFRRKNTSISNATRSIWDGRSSFTETAPNALQAIYIPPSTMRQNNPLSPLARNPHISDENSLEKKKPKFRVTRKPVTVQDMGRGKEEGIGLARGSGVMDEKYSVKIEANAGMWEDPVVVARRDSARESVMSWPRWRSPVSWVRDQGTRGWGRLSG